MNNNWQHIPILAAELAQLVIRNPAELYLDCTLGLGGHSKFFMGTLSEQGRIIGLDKDAKAIAMAQANINDSRLLTFNQSYTDAAAVLAQAGLGLAYGALFDLGLSSYQLDDATRGFSFQKDGPLDMRFDGNQTLTAAIIINTWPYDKLEQILTKYGGEPAAAKITHAILMQRQSGAIQTTLQLAKLIEAICPRSGKTHPATRAFQALRIAVNAELDCVEQVPALLPYIIKPGGRAAVLTFHSTEDRLIKYAFKALAATGNWQLVNKKVIEPQYSEVKQNPRARSAKLRVIQRLK